MSYEQERRATGMQRVPVQALVEICGRDIGGSPAFEAESVDVSGRGMHLRTAYLPEIGSPLVCRFETAGREIVVEGTVAWAAQQERGGEFGVQFTALDSGSVEALRELCGIAASAEAASPAEPEPSEAPAGTGKRVRLHIDGLGSPMKASVRGGGSKGIQVASNLEFLKVGRHLEIEDPTRADRRGAQIDTVNVVIDPTTQIPQLVVALRFDNGQEITPEPSVIDSSEEAAAAPAGMMADTGFEVSSASTDEDRPLEEDDFVQDDADEVMQDAQAMRGKFASFAVNAGSAAKKGGAVMAKASAIAATGMGRFFQNAGAAVRDFRSKNGRGAPKRTTAPAPSGVISAAGRRLRPQSGAAAQAEPTEVPLDTGAKKRRVKKIAAVSALGVLLLTIGVLAMKKQSAPPGAEAAAKDVPASIEVAAKPAGDVSQVDEQGNPIAAAAAQTDPNTANVPLFGPTPMATMEPAPLGAAPTGDEGGEADPEAAPASDEAKEKAAAAAAVEDQVFGDAGEDEGKTDKKPSSAAPWGNGKLHEPVIHRLRLDKAGTEIQGAANATGFTVMLPGVKVMEATKGIEQRDPRIARVKTRNSTNGAEISFQFKDGIPGYKVRLKKDYVEFMISSGKPEAKLASTAGAPKKAKKGTKKSASAASKASTSPKKGTKKGAKKKGAKKKTASTKKKAG